MIAQLESTVARPEIAWDGLLPTLTLGVGALLLVLFRSLMKRLPKAAADQAVPVIGGESGGGLCRSFSLAIVRL